MEDNPYLSPENAARVSKHSWKHLAAIAFLMPILASVPVYFWTFYAAGGWLVSTRLPPEQRKVFLGISFLEIMFAITATSFFTGLLILFRNHCYRRLTGCLLVPASVAFCIALLIFGAMLICFVQFGPY